MAAAVVVVSCLLMGQNLGAVEPESMLYSVQAVERDTAYRLKEEQLRVKLETVVDEKEAQSLQLQQQLLTKLKVLPDGPEKPSMDLQFSQFDAKTILSWPDVEQYLLRYIHILHESKLSAQNVENTNKQIQLLYNSLIALDEKSPEQAILQLQHAYQIRKLANQSEIDKQLRLGLDKVKEQYPELLKRTQVSQSMISSQLETVAGETGKYQKLEDATTLATASDDALIQQQESLLAGYLGHELKDDERKVMHYEQLKLLKHQTQKLLSETKKLEGRVGLVEAKQKALWFQLLGSSPDFFDLTENLGDLVKELDGLRGMTKKMHYQIYSREKELSTLRGGNALIGPKAEELISSLEENIKEIFTRLSSYDQRTELLEDKGEILKRTIDQKQSALGSMVTRTREATYDFLEKIMGVLKFPLLSYSGMSISLLLLLEVIVLLVCGIGINRLYGRVVVRMGRTRNWSERTIHLVQAIGKYPFIFIVAMVILSVVGINTSSLALIAGALSVGIGFGMQTIVNNLVSGIILLFDKSIRPGDFISLGGDSPTGGFRGNVVQMNIRATVLRTNDNISIIIPNADLMASQVVNWTYADEKIRFRVPFSVAYGSDIDTVKAVISKAVVDLPVVLAEPEPQVWLAKHADSSLEFLAAIWVEGQDARQPARTFDVVLTAIYKTLTRHGIEMPFPQIDLRLRKSESPPADLSEFRKLAN